MPRRIMKRMLLLGGVVLAMVIAGTASAEPPCFSHTCNATITATPQPRTWHVKGHVGERYLLYLNVYEVGRRLSYMRLPGNCDAIYSSADVAAVIHACGTTSTLRYVALDGRHDLQVEYRYRLR